MSFIKNYSHNRYIVMSVILICFLTVAVYSSEKPSSNTTNDFFIKQLYHDLKLPEDATDEQIIERLYLPVLEIQGLKLPNTIGACSLIEYKRVYAAIPNLLEIVNNKNEYETVRIAAARALCTLRNNEWIMPIKEMIKAEDEKIKSGAKMGLDTLEADRRIRIAALLARTGDYSEFEMLVRHIQSKEIVLRQSVVFALKEFRDPKKPETAVTADLLVLAATTDTSIFIREFAIRSLQKIVNRNPEMKSKLIKAAEANINCSDISIRGRSLRTLCKSIKYPPSPELKEKIRKLKQQMKSKDSKD